jgi:hypothetical protein
MPWSSGDAAPSEKEAIRQSPRFGVIETDIHKAPASFADEQAKIAGIAKG